jgi:hypothetical protein
MPTREWKGTTDDYETAANWTTATVPIAGDDVVLRDSAQAIATNLDQSAVVLNSFTVEQSYTGNIGSYADSAVTYLQIATPLLEIGRHDGYSSPTGSGQILLDLGSSTACTATILNSATTATDTSIMPIQIIAAHAGTKLFIKKGKIGIANAIAGETSTIDTIDVGYISSKASDALVTTGSGLTLETWNQTGGVAILRSGTTRALLLLDGKLSTEGTGTHDAISMSGGELVSNSTGTITLLHVYGGTADFLRSAQERTVTETKLWPGAVLKLDPAVVDLTFDPRYQDETIVTTSAP